MSVYRKLYNRILAKKSIVDELLREQGIDAQGNDSIEVSQHALLVYYAMKIRELQGRIAKFEPDK